MIDLPSLFFGAFVGAFAFTLLEVCKQTRRIVQRSRAWSWQNGYLYMIWIESLVNLVFAVVTFLHMNERIAGTLPFYFATVVLWTLQTQMLSQIIAYRVSLIMVSRQRATWLRWGLFALILGVNVGVFVVWIPAHLPGATARQRHLNDLFEKAEKSFFLVVNLGLNGFFLYLVRFRLIAGGLPKYWALFKMNAVLIVVSTAMDAALLGALSLSDPYVYVQFAPLAYTIKLYIELVMTSLIARVVSREVVPGQAVGDDSSRFPSFQPPTPMGHDRYGDKYGSTKSIFGDASIIAAPPPTPKLDTQSLCSVAAPPSSSHHHHAPDVEGRCEAPGDEVFLSPVPESSIIKTVTTTVVSEDKSSSPATPAPSSSAVGSIKSHKSHKSHQSHKSRLRSGAYDDWINDPAGPPTPPAKDGPPVALTRSKSRRQRLPLTSRFNQNQR